ncbi:MAG TPA: hypothetical protein PKD38_19170 [Nitrospira sp.]|nr:hypothetical protein [Nitrospira sp.]
MMSTYKFPHDLREGLIAALPAETSQHGETPKAGQMYLPAPHAKALHPNNTLIQGMRGSGKSFWFLALQSSELRTLIGAQVGLDASTLVTVGFGQVPGGNQFPSKDTLIQLVKGGCEPRRIWQAVVFRQVLGDRAPQDFKELSAWKARIQWIQDHPEWVDEHLYNADIGLDEKKQHHIVLFDALDRTADDWPAMNALVKGLLQLVLETRSFRRIRLKVFARPDQLEDPSVANFPDASKVMNQKVNLDWPRRELYGLLWQYLANDAEYGQRFREGANSALPSIHWTQTEDVWTVPELMRRSEDAQKQLFHAMTGPWMGRDKRRGFPYSWLPSHLGDARGEVSPRSFLAAVRQAASDSPRTEQEYLLHYESIKQGVQEASRIRVRELEEDYPWIKTLFDPLSGITVPCPFDDIRMVWRERKIIDHLRRGIESATVRLPPIHIDDGEDGVLIDLLDLGLVEKLKDQRINLPDVYRVGYGMGRRGGVKPYSA